jgi:Cu(I)/Ag(I) efflux system membrane fusion protein
LVNAQEEYLAALRSSNKLLLGASRERLAALGIADSEISRLDKERKTSQRVRVYAESDGVITHLGVREGIYVTAATEIMSVAELDKIWVLAEVFERQAAWVKKGQHAMVELDYLPGEMWHGTVDYVYPALRPNMFARVTIRGESTGEVVHVPREALIRGGSVDRLVVALGEGRFRAQPVDVGIESGDRVEIRRGVSAGDLIVTSGQFLIDSESNIEQALSKMDDAEEPMDHSQHQMEPTQ